ncbi:MAG: molybdopterin-guanine dinucleotide biosynthesis protein B, partial [Dehalococcoidia bacterium]|nr:molybdopterin-guanine dinucleotide biosynthesis protein B [Dehalococcoidia bacterium]
VSVVGRSNSGKTTLLEKLIVELKKRGYTVAAVKHSRGGFQLDYPGKDSWRLTEAGSDAVLMLSPHKLAYMQKATHPPTFEDVLDFLGDKYDFVLIEGFKEGDTMKIEVHRRELGGLVSPPENLFAVVTDERLDVPVPQFSSLDGVALVDLLEKTLITARSAVGAKASDG